MSHQRSSKSRRRIAVFGALLVAALVQAAAGDAAAQRVRDCAVTHQQGQGEIIREGAVLQTEPGIRLVAKDRVRTGAGAKLELACTDGIFLVVGERSTLDLGQLGDRNTADMILDLVEGIVRFVLPERRPPSRFEVTTPTTVASVRSTEWLAEATEKGTSVFVARGRVAVQGRAGGNTVEVAPGEGVDVPPGAVAPPPVRWGAPRVARALAAVTF